MSMRGRALDLGLAAFAGAQLGVAAWLVPVGDQVSLPDGAPLGGLCLVRGLFHVDCPFCGMTRSFVALAHGQLGTALQFHPAGPLLFGAMIVLVAAVVTVSIRRGRPLVERRQFIVAFEAVAMVCLVIGVFKMVRS